MKEIIGTQKKAARRPALRAASAAVAAIFCGLAASAAQAQAQLEVPDQDWTPNAEADVIKLSGRVGVTHDSNLLRLNNQSQAGIYSNKKAGDTYLTGAMGIEFDRLISQQRLRANAEVEGFKYKEYDDFDHVGYNVGSTLDWVVGRPLFGRAGIKLDRRQPTVQDRIYNQTTNVSGDRNNISTQNLFFNAGFRFTPAWSVIGGVDYVRSRNSLEVYKDTDYDLKSGEGGVRYAPGTGIEVDLVYRATSGEYKSAQRYGDDGSALLCNNNCRKNDYDEDSLQARVQYRPSEDSSLGGFVGYTRRDYDQGNRNFRGLTTGFDTEWAVSGAVQMRASLGRSIEPDDDAVTGSYADTWSLNFSPTIQATGKITVEPYLRLYDRRYKGDQLAAGQVERKDKIYMVGAEADYEFRRNMFLMASISREQRDSNRANLDYKANVFGLGLKVQF